MTDSEKELVRTVIDALTMEECRDCSGHGHDYGRECYTCRGSGRAPKTQEGQELAEAIRAAARGMLR